MEVGQGPNWGRSTERKKMCILVSVGFEVLTAMVMKNSISWDTKPCSPLKVNRSFGGICRLQLHGRRISQERN
jgi:hypothetical protein